MSPDIAQELGEITKQRGLRDVESSRKALLPAAISLKRFFNAWRNEELGGLGRERELLLSVATTPEAKNQLDNIEAELNRIETERIPEARQRLETFITKLQQKEMKNPNIVFDEISENLMPTVKLIGDLIGIRNKLDAMASMIPRPRKMISPPPHLERPRSPVRRRNKALRTPPSV
jgi:hypothetical protein